MLATELNKSHFALTGIEGVDQLLEGLGIPRGYAVLGWGGPGSGKTSFGFQFLINGVLKYEEPGVFVSLDEDPNQLRWNAARMGLELEPLEKEGKLSIIDATVVRFVSKDVSVGASSISVSKGEFAMASVLEMINRKIIETGAKRLVIDSLASLILRFPNEIERREAVSSLVDAAVATGATSLLISELSATSLERVYRLEEYLVQGVIVMRKRHSGVARVFSVEKMRGVNHDPAPHPYALTRGGLEVYSKERAEP